MKIPWGRLQVIMFFFRDIPGEYGIHLRSRKMRKYFGACGEGLRVHEGFKFRNLHKVELGRDVVIGVDNFFQAGGGIYIGDDTVLGPNTKIWTQSQIFESLETPIRRQGLEYREVIIGNDVWVGPEVFLMPGAVIGDGCVVEAGSIVEGINYPAYSIISGSPARVVGSRIVRSQPLIQNDITATVRTTPSKRLVGANFSD